MISWEERLRDLWADVIDKKRLEDELEEYRNTGQSKVQEDENRAEIEQQIMRRTGRIERNVEAGLCFPKYHLGRHLALLDEFWRVADYERSVFVMTKYPERDTDNDKKLKEVIQTVRDAVSASGFTPRLASDQEYHPQLWDNIELYLVGCSRGVAIVEDKHTRETNPNVSMEWGWMRGMGRDVLFLIEKEFKSPRADFVGFISKAFDFADPKANVPEHVATWLRRKK
jgi:hypothetical protein